MEMEKMKTTGDEKSGGENSRAAGGESSRAEFDAKALEAEPDGYSQLRSPSEDIYTEALFGGSAAQRKGERKVRVLQAACAVLSCVSLVLLLILIHFSVSKETCSDCDCHDPIPQDCPRCLHCPPGWKESGRSCFFFSTTRLNWDDSQRNCSASGAALAVITTPRVKEYLTLNAALPSWIGAVQGGGDSGSGLLRTIDPPVGECALLTGKKEDLKSWTSDSCWKQAYFICHLEI